MTDFISELRAKLDALPRTDRGYSYSASGIMSSYPELRIYGAWANALMWIIDHQDILVAALQPSDSPALEAGAAEARVAKLEEVLGDLLSWFDKPSEPEWRIKAGPYGADDAVEAARAALATPAKEPGK